MIRKLLKLNVIIVSKAVVSQYILNCGIQLCYHETYRLDTTKYV